MTWGEKLLRILGDRSLAEVERAVGLVGNTLSERVRNNRRINVEDGLAVARYVGVDPYWLFDDAQNWPPPALVPQSERSFRERVVRVVAEALSAVADKLGEDRRLTPAEQAEYDQTFDAVTSSLHQARRAGERRKGKSA